MILIARKSNEFLIFVSKLHIERTKSITIMHLILTGATGLVGAGVLDAMLNNKAITKISILTRSNIQLLKDRPDPRVNIIQHSDFNSYPPSVLSQLQGASGCVWALGISQTKVNAEDYVTITKDYTLNAARAFSQIEKDEPGPFRFVYVSGEGATQKPGMFSPIFARVKGETEVKLGEISEELKGKLQADSMRPCFVDAHTHEAIKPYIPDPGMVLKVLATTLRPLTGSVMAHQHSPTEFLGKGLVEMAMGRLDGQWPGMEPKGVFKLGGAWVVENKGLRAAMGL